MLAFEDFATFAKDYGIIDIFVPFLLIFAVVYAILAKLKTFPKNINVVISIIMSALTVIPHVLGQYPECWDVITIMNNSFAKIGLLILACLVFLFIVGVLGLKIDFMGKAIGWIAVAAIAVVGFTFLTSGGPGCNPVIGDLKLDLRSLLVLLPIITCIALVWWILSDKGGSDKST